MNDSDRLHTLPAAAFALLLLLTAGLLAPAVAQEVRGTIVSADSGEPIEGAYVGLLNAEGEEVASAVTGENGSLSLRVRSAGEYRVRVQRIGFDTWESDSFTATPTAIVSREFLVPVRPIDLAELVVSVEGRCASPDEGHELLRVWEEARKALRLTRLTEQNRAIRYELRKWTRTLEPRSWKIEDEDATRGTQSGRASFVSLPAAALAADGYVQRDEDAAYHFFVPDADVLLSDVFLEDHCLRLVYGEEENEPWIGIGFEPAGSRDNPDVEGVLWLDPITAELRHMEFEYTRLDQVQLPRDAWAGGRLEFRRAPTGDWFASRWWIRIPVYRRGVRATLQRGVGANTISQRMTTSVEVYREIGGEVERLALGDGREMELSQWGTVVGTAVDDVDNDPVTGAVVRLVGTDRTARTDEEGRFQLDFIAPGAYTVALEHPDDRLAGIPTDEQALTVLGEEVTRLELTQSMNSVVERICAPTDTELSEGDESPSGIALLGRVEDAESGEPLPDGLVWIRNVAGGDPVVVEADTEGTFLVCGLDPRGVVAQASGQGMLGQPDTLRLPEAGLVVRDFAVAPFTVAVGEASTDAATLRGVVRSAESGDPVAGARVHLLGSDFERITGEDGTFTMVGVPLGTQHLVTEYLGAASDTAAVDLTGGAISVALLTLETRPVQLPTLHVEIERSVRNPRLAGYYQRMDRKIGDFITREDLETRDIVSNMRRIQGVSVTECVQRPRSITTGAIGPSRGADRDANIAGAPLSQLRMPGECWEIDMGRSLIEREGACAPVAFLNGHIIGGMTDNLMSGFTGENVFSVISRLPRDMIEGIEVHRNAATAPAQYRGFGAACGVILVWTRARP